MKKISFFLFFLMITCSAFAVENRVGQTTTTTGTGTISLSSVAKIGHVKFEDVYTSSDPVTYLIQTQDMTEWEIGQGTFIDSTTDTIIRDATPEASSNSGNPVSFSAGTKDVYNIISAAEYDTLIFETAASIAALNHGTAAKSALVDADEITGQDSENSFSLIRTTWTSVKAFLKTYFDGIYEAADSTLTDIADGIINENLVNTANPWEDNEIASAETWNAKQDALTNSAGLAGALSDEIGTGKAVFANSFATGAADNDQIATKGYVDDNAGGSGDSGAKIIGMTFPDPESYQAILDAWTVFCIEAEAFPSGITITDCGIKTSASSSYAVNFEEWTSPTDGSPSTIENVATSTSTEAEDDGTINDGSIAAGSIIKVDLPTTAEDELVIWIVYTVN